MLIRLCSIGTQGRRLDRPGQRDREYLVQPAVDAAKFIKKIATRVFLVGG